MNRTITDYYSEPHRYYHTWDHIEQCLKELERIKNYVDDYASIYLAILFHDIVYDPRRTDNEEKSVEVAKFWMERISDLMIFNPMFDYITEKVCKLIMCTKNHKAGNASVHIQNDIKYFLDVDLSILGQPKKVFDEYERNIRKEYYFVPDVIYKKERSKILKKLLNPNGNLGNIYFTELFCEKYEDKARENIGRSLEKLRV